MRRLALVLPRGAFVSENREFEALWAESPALRASSFFTPMPNLGLLTVAALTPSDYAVEFLDENRGPIDFGAGYDLVGLTGMTLHAERAYQIAREFRSRGSVVAMGGIHATVRPDEAAGYVDSVIVGEAEELWPRFLRDFEAGSVERFYRSAGGRARLSDSPVPRYDLVEPERYPVTPVQTTRGCPHDCEFCSVGAIYGRQVRCKDIGQVVAEVRAATRARRKGRPRVFFADDNMFYHRERACELLRALAPLRVNWMTQCDVSVAEDEALLRLIRESGGSQLLIGFESLSGDNLKSLQPTAWKAGRRHRYAEAVRAIQAQGIRVLGMFIVGLDQDTPEVFDELRAFVLDNHLHDAQITFQTPLPGSRLFDRLAAEGRLLSDRFWDRCSFFEVAFHPNRMSRDELVRGHAGLYRALLDPLRRAATHRHFIDVFKALDPLPGPAGEDRGCADV